MSSYIEPQMVRIIHQKPEKTLSFKMIKIRRGSFMMGSDEHEDERPPHKVSIDYDFYLGKYPVTIGQYMMFAEEKDGHYPEWMEKGSEYNIETGTDDHYKGMDFSDDAPVMGVSWHDAKAFCEWLSKKSGKEYRLPTEAEWEYAARAGTTTKWSFGDDESELEKYAWYSKNSYDLGEKHPDYGTHPVGKKLPNPWGLYDMHGNVWEWCEDDYVDSYKETPRDGSAHKDKDANSKVLRGGSWLSIAVNTRSSIRFRYVPVDRYRIRGFRLLRTLPS